MSTVRLVTDPLPGLLCLAWVHDDRHLCHLVRGHRGACLALPKHWPVMDITRDNPRYTPTPRRAA